MRFSALAVPLVSVALSAATALIISSGAANADGVAATDTVPRLISYTGRVEFSGVPYVGTLEMRFRLYDVDRGETPIFSEEYTEEADRAVAVHAGEFSVMLGQYAADLQTAITGADALTLGVEVRTPGETEWIPLAGRQAITASPYAMWAIQGTDFSIARDGFVGRNLDVIGTSLLRGETAVDGGLNVSGTTNMQDANVLANAFIGGNLTVNGDTAVDGSITGARFTGNVQATNFSLSGEYTIQTRGENDVAGVNMTSTSNSFCFLTQHRSPDDSGENDLNECSIDVSGSVWRLSVYTSSDNNWITRCRSRCFTYR